MMALSEIARALGGEVAGRQVLAPGPGHSSRDRSLAVRVSPTAPGGIVVHSHAGDPWPECRDHVLAQLGIPRQDRRAQQDPIVRIQERARRQHQERADRHERIAKARALWNVGREPRGTLVEAYLRSRGLELPAEVAGSVLRFHPAVPWRDEAMDSVIRVPAMLVAMRNIETDEVTAVHRTAFTTDAAKIGKRMFGIARGAAIKLDPDSAIGEELVIGEGIESTLSARQLGFGPAWAMGSVVAIDAFPVLATVNKLSILEELGDSGASASAVRACGSRWTAHGREVVAIRPVTGNDMNDALRGIS